MKKKKSNTAIVATTIGGLLSSSCSGYFNDDGDLKYSSESGSMDYSSNIISLTDDLSEEEYEYLNALVRIFEDIFRGVFVYDTNKEDIKKILGEYGYQGNLLPSEDVVKLMNVFSSEQILKTIQNRDVTTFIKILKENGLLSGDKESALNSLDKSVQDVLSSLVGGFGKMRSPSPTGGDDLENPGCFYDVVAIAAVVVAVALEVAIAVLVAVVGAASEGDQPAERSNFRMKRLLEARKANALDFFIAQVGSEEILQYANSQIDEACQYVYKALDEYNPDIWTEISKDEIRSRIATVYINYLF